VRLKVNVQANMFHKGDGTCN